MVYSDIIKQKADEYQIDIGEPSGLGRVRVCKKMLEGLFALLDNSHTEIFHKLKKMEQELLGIKNEFERINRSPLKTALVASGYIESSDAIVKRLRVAYSIIAAATMRKEDFDKFQVYEDIFEHLPECQDAIFAALSLFDSSL